MFQGDPLMVSAWCLFSPFLCHMPSGFVTPRFCSGPVCRLLGSHRVQLPCCVVRSWDLPATSWPLGIVSVSSQLVSEPRLFTVVVAA